MLSRLYEVLLQQNIDEACIIICQTWIPKDTNQLFYIFDLMDQYLNLMNYPDPSVKRDTKGLLTLYDTVFSLMDCSIWDISCLLFQVSNWSLIEFLCVHNRISLSDKTLLFILSQREDWFYFPANAPDLLDLHSSSCVTTRVIQHVIQHNTVDILQGCFTKQIKNTSSYLLYFANTYSNLTLMYSKTALYDKLYLLLYYFLRDPCKISSYKEMRTTDKKAFIIEAMFQTRDPDMVEYVIRFFLTYQDSSFDKDLITELRDLSSLCWDGFPNDKEVYRKAQINPISSQGRHMYMGQFLIMYTGDDKDLLSMRSQCYLEHKHRKKIEPMEELILE